MVAHKILYQRLASSVTGEKSHFTIIVEVLMTSLCLISINLFFSNDSLDERRYIFNNIMQVVQTQHGNVFFLYGYVGTGKTYMWNTLSTAIRSKRKFALTVEYSGITSLLLPEDRTTYSKFKISVPPTETSICNKTKNLNLSNVNKSNHLR